MLRMLKLADVELAQNPPREPSSTGLDAHVAAALAYLAGPFSGVLILLAEQTNPYVRFHAWQSIVGLGGLGVFVVLLGMLAFGSVDRLSDRVPRADRRDVDQLGVVDSCAGRCAW